MIKLNNVSLSYGKTKAVDDLTLQVNPGEIYAFLGPNAAGKTSTINIITGLLKPQAGKVEICGLDVNEKSTECKSKLGYVPDVAIFYEKLTPTEFIDFIADLFGIDKSSAQEKAKFLFKKFHLEEYKDDLIQNLSHGTKQRIAIASALIHEPKVLVIDEPMVGLDPLHTKIIKNTLIEEKNKGTTIFMSTHLLNIAEELADRIGILNRGKLLAEGTINSLRDNFDSKKNSELEKVFLSLVKDSENKLKNQKTKK